MNTTMNRNDTKARALALSLSLGLAGFAVAAAAANGDDLLATYGKSAGPFSAAAGQRVWTDKHQTEGEARSCVTCHGTDLTKPGKHATTGKVIEPMAVSADPKRLTDPAKVEKWFGRNCKWTLGRECTPQEKGDVVKYLQSL